MNITILYTDNRLVIQQRMEISNVRNLRDAIKIFMQDDKAERAYKFLEEMFGDELTVPIIINVSKNITLFRLYQISKCEKFSNLNAALKEMDEERSKQKVLIHFTELGLYGIFTPEQYMLLTNTLADRIYDGENISFRPKQIILSGLPQKLIFICLGDENMVEKIRGYVEQKYKCGITHVKTDNRIEITVQGIGGNTYEEAQKSYQDLFDYISTKQRDLSVANNLLPLPIMRSDDRGYVVADMSYDLSDRREINEIISALKTIHGENVVINLTIITGNGNVIHNHNNFGDNASMTKTLKWVTNNLPAEKEVTTVYYNRYVANYDGEKVSDSQLGKIVRSLGYKPVRGTHHRFWVKK